MSKEKEKQGLFEILSSVDERANKEFHLIGHVQEGAVKEGWYLNLRLQNGMLFTVRITSLSQTPVAGKKEQHTLIIKAEDFVLDVLSNLAVESQVFEITKEGKN
ncbi:MAG: hypothetical protein ACHQRM_00740 [Bacteroidia bacterium]